MSTKTPPRTDTRKTIAALNTCIEICTDGEKGYGLAAADVRDRVLKALFMQYAKERAEFVVALQDAVIDLGVVPENEGSFEGALHRGFTVARRALEGGNDCDSLIIRECERGERAGIAGYDRLLHATSAIDLRPYVTELLSAQRKAMKGAHYVVQERLAAS